MYLIPKKSLGQHFLNSKRVLVDMIGAAKVKRGDIVLEIGPGKGILTKELLEVGADVIAVEKDHRAVELLKVESGKWGVGSGRFTLIEGDILELDLDQLGLKQGNYSIVANIPYYITGAILERFLAYEPRPKNMVILVQKEVAERIVAKNGKTGGDDGKESILSISVKAFGIPKIISRVSRGCFTPPPKVDSAILSIENISDDLFLEDNDHKNDQNLKSQRITRFFEIVRAGFAHKRKILKRNLETVMTKDEIERKWEDLSLSDNIRAEDITLRDWLNLSSDQ